MKAVHHSQPQAHDMPAGCQACHRLSGPISHRARVWSLYVRPGKIKPQPTKQRSWQCVKASPQRREREQAVSFGPALGLSDRTAPRAVCHQCPDRQEAQVHEPMVRPFEQNSCIVGSWRPAAGRSKRWKSFDVDSSIRCWPEAVERISLEAGRDCRHEPCASYRLDQGSRRMSKGKQAKVQTTAAMTILGPRRVVNGMQ